MSELLAELSARHPEIEVWAAGGVIHRDGPTGPEVLLVHRPAYDDWSLPKGKLDRGETMKQAARREVEEETGLGCRVGEKVGFVRYIDNRGREKGVFYWLMTAERGTFAPNREVDEIEWLPLHRARRRCTYGHDADLIRDRVDRVLLGG